MSRKPNIPNTSKASSGVEVVNVLGTGLETTAEKEDDGADEDGPLSAEAITCRAGEHGAEEGTASEDGDNSTAVPC